MIREKEFVVLKSVYPPEVVMKTAYLFLEQAYIHLQEDSTSWIVHLTSKEDALPENIGQRRYFLLHKQGSAVIKKCAYRTKPDMHIFMSEYP